MLTEDKMKRLNELAKKAKTDLLTDDEKSEQKLLRDEYLSKFRHHFRKRLENIVFLDEEGNEVNRTIH